MAKPIYAPQDEIERVIEAFRMQARQKCFGSIDIRKSFSSDNRSALLYFTPEAWCKMIALVWEFSTEVQWHGLVRRISECEFEIYDIIVPPHSVTAATVTSDQEKYTAWLNGLDDDTFKSLKFHGHSHVRMAVTPSVTDTDYRKNVLVQLPKPTENEDEFYIFLIINKDLAWSAEIYDLKYNALYSSKDKEIAMTTWFDDGGDVDSFVAHAKKVAVATPVTTPTTNAKNGYAGYSGYGGYNGYGYTGASYGYPRETGGNNYGAKQQSTASKSVCVPEGSYKKNETKKDRREDDDYYGVDEDPSDPFYCREWGRT